MKIPKRTGVGRIFSQSVGNDNGAIVIKGKPKAVESPVMVFAQAQPVVDAVVVKLSEGFDVRAIYDILQIVQYLQPAKGAAVVVDRGNNSPKRAISDDGLLLVFAVNLQRPVDTPAYRE